MAKGKAKRKVGGGDVASNRYASHRYELIERLECGIVLEGTEVKALRTSGAQLKDGYAAIRDGELWLHSVHIPPFGPAARENHAPERVRKLLAHRRELDRIAQPQARAAALAAQDRAQLVQLPPLARRAPIGGQPAHVSDRQHPLVHRLPTLAEGDERAGGDQADHFAREAPLPATRVENLFQREAAGDVVRVALDRHRLALAL